MQRFEVSRLTLATKPLPMEVLQALALAPPVAMTLFALAGNVDEGIDCREAVAISTDSASPTKRFFRGLNTREFYRIEFDSAI
jgi:hypothetical protein